MIKFNNVSIEYPIMQLNSHSFRARIEYFLSLKRKNNFLELYKSIQGLKNVTFQINNGERIGVIGHNGSGKTTLLRGISGIYPPTSGKITIKGKVNSIIDISFGFEDELSGLKNIEHGLVFDGYTFREAKRLAPFIAKEAYIGDAIHRPIYTYSTGMALRLAFALATFDQPEILVMDEILGAGDEAFRSIAQKKIDTLIDASKICILSSHDLSAIRKYTTQCILMDAGQIKFFGHVKEAIKIYQSFSKNV